MDKTNKPLVKSLDIRTGSTITLDLPGSFLTSIDYEVERTTELPWSRLKMASPPRGYPVAT